MTAGDCTGRNLSISLTQPAPLSVAQEQSAKSKQRQARLPANHVPKQPRGFVSINLSQRLARRVIQHVHQFAIIVLLEMVQRSPYEPVRFQFSPKRAQFAAAFLKNRVGHSTRAAEPGHDSANRGNFYLRGGVAHQIHLAISHGALHIHPTAIHGNSGTLPFQRLKPFFLEEAVKAALCVAPMFSNYAQRSTFRGLWNQPVKVWSVIGNEPRLLVVSAG